LKLLQPLQVGALRLPNRVVMAPMTRSRARDGLPTAETARYYAQRATAGLIVSEATHIAEETAHSPTSAGIYTPAQIAAWAVVADAVHLAGGRMFLQLWHLGRAWHGSRHRPVGPSSIAARVERPGPDGVVRPLPEALPLDADGLRRIVHQYCAAAENALRAGMDGVEIHAANGFLLDQFLRDGSNRRTDGYGGSAAGRARLLLEVAEAVAFAVGRGRVGVRLSPCKTFNDMHDSEPFNTFPHAVSELNRLGLAYLHLASEAPGSPGLDPATNGLTQRLRRHWDGPLILNGGYTCERAEAALATGEADLISFGSAFIANPDLVRRLRENAPLNAVDRSRIYAGGPAGYTDYPSLPERPQESPAA